MQEGPDVGAADVELGVVSDVHVDHDKAEDIRKNIGCMLQSEDLDGGRMGVRGLLYFDFSVLDEEGVVVHPPGLRPGA